MIRSMWGPCERPDSGYSSMSSRDFVLICFDVVIYLFFIQLDSTQVAKKNTKYTRRTNFGWYKVTV